jgi:hypothetical protein
MSVVSGASVQTTSNLLKVKRIKTRHVYAWCGMGVAACYDLEGRRQWITRVPVEHLEYGSSPALADGDCLYLRGERYLYCIGTK